MVRSRLKILFFYKFPIHFPVQISFSICLRFVQSIRNLWISTQTNPIPTFSCATAPLLPHRPTCRRRSYPHDARSNRSKPTLLPRAQPAPRSLAPGGSTSHMSLPSAACVVSCRYACSVQELAQSLPPLRLLRAGACAIALRCCIVVPRCC